LLKHWNDELGYVKHKRIIAEISEEKKKKVRKRHARRF
jgi:hypothetical protein